MVNDNEYKKNMIIGESRHHFIYGYDGEERTNFLKEIEKENPVVTNIDKPMAVYIDDYGLPNINYDKKKVDRGLITIVSTEFLNFSVLSKIIESYIDNNEINDNNVVELMKYTYKVDINNLNDLLKMFKESKEFYKKYYLDYLKHGNSTYKVSDIKFPFVDLLMYLDHFKTRINNDSYFSILIDNNKDVSIPSIRAINFYVGGRINRTISMNVATDPEKWKTYTDCNGNLIQSLHDYGDIEYDDSLKKVLSKRRL